MRIEISKRTQDKYSVQVLKKTDDFYMVRFLYMGCHENIHGEMSFNLETGEDPLLDIKRVIESLNVSNVEQVIPQIETILNDYNETSDN